MKITKVLFITGVFCLIVNLNNILNAQIVEDIITDRPDQTESAATIPKNHIQFEAGGTFDVDKSENSIMTKNYSAPSVLIRYGLLNNVELRLGSEYSQEKIFFNETEMSDNKGFAPLYLGTKIGLIKEKKIIPQTAVIIGLQIPFEKNNIFQPEKAGIEYRLTMKHTLNETFTLSYNLGGEWDGDEKKTTALYTLSLGISLADKLGMYAESYGFYSKNSTADNRMDGGLTYLLMPNLQGDVSAGFGINETSPDYYLGLGMSYRIPK